MAFKPGHDDRRGKGGKREGSGRSPDWLKEYTRTIVEKDKLVDRLAQIARGENIEQPLSNGEVVPIPAPVAEQRKAILDLLERGWGKATQPVSGEDGGAIVFKVIRYGNNDPV